MATITGQAADFSPNVTPTQSGASADFASFGDFIDTVKEPNYQRAIQKKYHEELGITALLEMNSLEQAVNRDSELYHYEDTRLYIDGSATAGAAITAGTSTGAVTFTDTAHSVRENDNLVIDGGTVVHVTSTTTDTFTAVPYDATWNITVGSGNSVEYFVFGNEFGKGTNQPTEYLIDNVERIESKLMIMKDTFTMTGSEMTDKTWIDGLRGTGAYIYRAEERGFMRFKAYEEMQMVYGQEASNSNLSSLQGTKGLFRQIEDRGNVLGDYLSSLSDYEDLTEVLDAVSAPAQYAQFTDSRQFNLSQNLISDATGLVSYGLFNNDENRMVSFGFKGLSISGYEFYLKKWNLLNNPQLGGKKKVYKGAFIPMGTVKTQEGNLPNLSILYKQLGSYNRKFESWMVGAADGVYNDSDGFDGKTVNYRSEKGFRGVAMNSFALIK